MNSLGFGKPAAHTRVVVGMSGGVDSSTVAALLKGEGYDVIGITLQLYDHGRATGRPGACCAGQDIHDARNVADALGIPHYVLDYERRFARAVIDDFADNYVAGLTPIPCVRCNQTVKFRDLLAMARELGADALATGHYARRLESAQGPELHRASEEARDQSYFLFATTREQLSYLRFPLGALGKGEVRALARRFNLPVAEKRDSQDICFVPGGDYARVIERLRPEALAPGEIVDLEGRLLGRHEGVAHFTVGQRRGLAVSGSEPLYVVRLEPQSRRVVVGPRRALGVSVFTARALNWLDRAPLAEEGVPAHVKIRSTRPGVAAWVRPLEGQRVRVALDEPEEGVAPGQACVIYAKSRVLGGAWIERPGAEWRASAAA